MISVLMSVYAKESPSAFRAALESIRAQTTAPDEIVLVKDGPLPEDLEYEVNAFSSVLPMKVIELPRNMGLTVALNTGLRHASMPWIMRFDTDDICAPHRVEVQLARIKKADVDLFGSQIAEFVEDPALPVRSRRVPRTHEEICLFALRRNPFNHMTVCFRREAALRVGGYPDIAYMEDYALWLSMIAAGARTANLPDVLVYARVGNEHLARRGGWRYVQSEWRLQSLMHSLMLKPAYRSAVDGAMRSSVFLAPQWLRGMVYKNVLRDDRY